MSIYRDPPLGYVVIQLADLVNYTNDRYRTVVWQTASNRWSEQHVSDLSDYTKIYAIPIEPAFALYVDDLV